MSGPIKAAGRAAAGRLGRLQHGPSPLDLTAHGHARKACRVTPFQRMPASEEGEDLAHDVPENSPSDAIDEDLSHMPAGIAFADQF